MEPHRNGMLRAWGFGARVVTGTAVQHLMQPLVRLVSLVKLLNPGMSRYGEPPGQSSQSKRNQKVVFARESSLISQHDQRT